MSDGRHFNSSAIPQGTIRGWRQLALATGLRMNWETEGPEIRDFL